MDLARFSPRTIMAAATVAMLVQQAFSYVCQIALPILADQIAEDFGISRAWLGFYLFLQNVAAIIAAVGCGGFILRYGPLRVSQVALLLMGSSLLVTASAQLWLFPLGALLLGAASVSTPASSHILARVTPLRLAPLIFSIKQTGVPVGALIGGLLVPFLLALTFYSDTLGLSVRLGPYGASFVTCLVVFAVMVSLEPVRTYFDADRRPDTKIAFGDLPATLKTVLAIRPLRDLSFAAFAFGGLQALFSGFFILFLIDGLDYSEAEAGSAFAIASFSAVWARILWGALGGGAVSPRIIMAGIGLVAGLSAVATALYGVEWTFWEITAVAVVFNMTALSWHGILLAETARLAPEGQVGGVTGGVLAFTSIAMMIYPALYGGLLAWTGSYGIGFILGAVPSFAAFVIFVNPPVDGAWTGLAARFGRRLLSRRALARAGAVTALGSALGVALNAAGW